QGFAWATRQEDRNRLWKARHEAYYAGRALRPGATAVVTDCCVPISALAACIAETQEEVASSGLIAPLVGHVGDGNFHLLVLVEPGNRAEIAQARALAASVNEIALRHGGTITGEHGVGSGKLDYMAAEHGGALSVMAAIKRALDPHDIMNPGKVVPLN
ncbi:MAG: FAD-binding oxidoreductase, partial [Shimia sp.]